MAIMFVIMLTPENYIKMSSVESLQFLAYVFMCHLPVPVWCRAAQHD